MPYSCDFSDDFRETLIKIKKKNKLLSERINKKILEIIENPAHYKPLRFVLKGKRRVHIGQFVIVFKIIEDIIPTYLVEKMQKIPARKSGF